jgi:hypothetical protein
MFEKALGNRRLSIAAMRVEPPAELVTRRLLSVAAQTIGPDRRDLRRAEVVLLVIDGTLSHAMTRRQLWCSKRLARCYPWLEAAP